VVIVFTSRQGVHRRRRESNLRTRVFPVSPRIRITYWELPLLRTYRLPEEEVPSGVNVRILLDPSLIGFEPGAALLPSGDGSPGCTPKSTPLK
jgi:hypothetical protein